MSSWTCVRANAKRIVASASGALPRCQRLAAEGHDIVLCPRPSFQKSGDFNIRQCAHALFARGELPHSGGHARHLGFAFIRLPGASEHLFEMAMPIRRMVVRHGANQAENLEQMRCLDVCGYLSFSPTRPTPKKRDATESGALIPTGCQSS